MPVLEDLWELTLEFEKIVASQKQFAYTKMLFCPHNFMIRSLNYRNVSRKATWHAFSEANQKM